MVNPVKTINTTIPTNTAVKTPPIKQATIWNPTTGQKQVINSGAPMPKGFSLWTGGNATGNQAKTAIVPPKGVNTNPAGVVDATLDQVKQSKEYQDLLNQNKTLLENQANSQNQDNNDAYTSAMNSFADNIKSTMPSFNPNQAIKNQQDLNTIRNNENNLALNNQSSLDAATQQPGVLMNGVQGEQALINQQYQRQQNTLSAQETNLINQVNLDNTTRQQVLDGTKSLSDISTQIQSHIDTEKQSAFNEAQTLTSSAQNNLANALTSLKGVTWESLSRDQQNQLTQLAQQGGFPVALLQSSLDAIANQTVLDNSLKLKTANQPIQIGEDMMGNKIYGTFNQDTGKWDQIDTSQSGGLGLSDNTGTSDNTANTVNTTGSVSYQNNNPGNIKWTGAPWQIALGATDSGIKATDGGTFAKFSSLDNGNLAQKQLLTGANYANLSVDQAMKKWSNNGYDGTIAPDIANKKISNLTPDELNSLMDKMKTREGFIPPSTLQGQQQQDLQKQQQSAAQYGVDFNTLSGYQQQVWSSVPDQYKSYAEQIAHYKQSFSGLGMGGAKLKPIVSDLVNIINPDYNENNFAAAKTLTTSLTSGDIANKKIAINNVIGHITALTNDFAKLNNGNIPAWNSIAQATAVATGNKNIQEAQANVNEEIQAITTEISKVYKTGLRGQASPTEEQIAAWSKGLSSTGTPSQLKGSLTTAMDLLTTVLQNIQGQVDSVPGITLPTDAKTMLTPTSQQNISNLKSNGYNLGFIDQFVNQSNAQISDQYVNLGGQNYKVGQVITNAQGQKGQVESDGTINIIQ